MLIISKYIRISKHHIVRVNTHNLFVHYISIKLEREKKHTHEKILPTQKTNKQTKIHGWPEKFQKLTMKKCDSFRLHKPVIPEPSIN